MHTRYSLGLAVLATWLLGAAGLLVLNAAAAPAGTAFYVDPSGNDGNACLAPGSSFACKTIGGALAKAALSGDTIVVAAGTYAERPTINKSVTINGAGAISTTVDGTLGGRVLTVTTGTTVLLSNFSVTNGQVSGGGGGILNHGTLTLDGLSVVTNTAALGGGIYNDGVITISNSSIISNAATLGGGLYNDGTSITTGAVILDHTRVGGNHATGNGGGAYNTHSGGLLPGLVSLALQNGSVFADNSAGDSGGAIYNDSVLSSNGSTFQGNSAAGSGPFRGGGAIALAGGTAASTNDLLSGNSNMSGSGGGIAAITGTLTLTGTNLTANHADASSGGAIRTGPAGAVSISGGSLSGNTAGALGAGVFNSGVMTLTSVALTQNSSGGGIDGGGIANANAGSMRLDHVLLAQNQASKGGAIANFGSLSIDASSIVSNTASNNGGAVDNNAGATLVMHNVSLAGNNAYFNGGGVSNAGALTLTQSTLSGNSVTINGGSGGGLLNQGTATLGNATLSGNLATMGGGIYNGGQAKLVNVTLNNRVSVIGTAENLYMSSGVLTLTNTIVNSDGSVANCFGAGNPKSVSIGGNLANDTSCGLTGPGDQQSPLVPILLGPLGNYGGPTETQLPQPGSAAIDNGLTGACAAPPVNSVDQRGAARLSDAQCDIGADETGAWLWLPLIRR